MNEEQKKPADGKTKKLPSVWCWYMAGGAFLLWSLVLPLYKLTHYLLAGLFAAAAWFLASKMLPKEEILLPEKAPDTGDALADSVVAEGRAALRRLDEVAARIESPAVKASIRSIDGTMDKILQAIEQAPKKASLVRRLIGYYLPTLVKLAGHYETLEEQGLESAQVRAAMARIEDNLRQLDLALKKQLDQMYEQDVTDISVDVAVMEQMLAREGLLGSPIKASSHTQPVDEETSEGIVLKLEE